MVLQIFKTMNQKGVLAQNGRSYTLLEFLEYYDDYKYTGWKSNNWYVDPDWEERSWYADDEDDVVPDATDEAFAPINSEDGGCYVCGCLSEFDELGDRVCWCDACKFIGCKPAPIDAWHGGECHICGCLSEFDELGDRVCWCDACKINGCKRSLIDIHGGGECSVANCLSESDEHCDKDCLCDVNNISGCIVPMPLESVDSSIEVVVPLTSTDTSSIETCQVLHTGKELWDASTLWSPAKRLDENGRSYSLAEFEQWYGQKVGRQKWKAAQISNITPILHLIGDVERRTTLHLAHLRKNPKTYTPCCSQAYCFRCHVGTWHSGTTCEENCANGLDVEVQFCPCCNVPTQRTEGCSSMVCPCGKNWHWEGGSDVSDDDY